MRAMEISLSGLDVEWRRLEVIADNLANAGAAQTPGGGYQSMRLLSGPRTAFAQHLGGPGAGPAPGGVVAYAVEPMNLPPRVVREPAHPLVDEHGDVAYPGLDHAAEMTLMVRTARAYEANLVMIGIAREMYVKAMDLGKGA